MHPTICKIGPVTIQSYGLTLAVAAVVCGFLLSRDAAKAGIPQDTILDLMFWLVFAGVVGARIFFILLNGVYYFEHPVEIIMIQNGGLAWQGGLLGGALAGMRFVRRRKLPLRTMLDLVAPYIALGQSIGRIGCFLTGCCYGRPVSWGIYFPMYDAHLHPTQLYDVGALFLVFLILKSFQCRSHRRGEIFVLYLFLAALERFTVEFFRGDHNYTFLGLSVYQWVTLLIAAVAVVLYRNIRKTQEP